MAGQPKAPFWLVLWVVILGLVGLSAWRAGLLEPFGVGKPGGVAARPAAPVGPAGGAGDDSGGGAEGVVFEAADSSQPTTVKEYKFTAAE